MNTLSSIPAAPIEAQKVLTRAEIEAVYGSELDGNPSVYCGTYAKYNEGCLYGLWLDLTSFDSYDEFIEVCNQLHADEVDPELMFQDFGGFPSCLYSESCMDEETFDKIIEYANLSENDQEALDDYLSFHDFDIEEFKCRYQGKWSSEIEFAEHIVNEFYDFIIRKTKCFVTAKRNVLFAKRSVYKKELLLYCDTRGTLFLFVNT